MASILGAPFPPRNWKPSILWTPSSLFWEPPICCLSRFGILWLRHRLSGLRHCPREHRARRCGSPQGTADLSRSQLSRGAPRFLLPPPPPQFSRPRLPFVAIWILALHFLVATRNVPFNPQKVSKSLQRELLFVLLGFATPWPYTAPWLPNKSYPFPRVQKSGNIGHC